MKKLVVTAAMLACAASMASAQTVTSANMVGYAKVNAIGGQLTLVALNFETGGLTLNDVFGTLPSASAIHLWDKTGNTYITSTKGRAGFSPNSVIGLGDAFWIQAAGTGTNEVILSGEVLLSATNVVSVATGLDATGYFYPVETLWQDTDLAAQLPSASAVHIWNGVGYSTYTKGRAGWSGNPTIGVGSGFWVQSPSSFTWSEVRPFNP
ncbi:MAG: hypothetical protein K9M54_07390 [Kiritimatiellales bacterium]|nr:hypothetical protein [Kiritimatiellales bacterium]MCF7863174.1 hypothetical protein [Kiritimatiellales bacterium]